jgi:hypothetical protein
MDPVYPIIALYASAALFCAVIFLTDPKLRSWVLKAPIHDEPAGTAEPRLPE